MKIIILITALFVPAAFAEDVFHVEPFTQIQQENAYGPGLHMDQYGRPVEIAPQNGSRNPYTRIQQEDAYGPGIHMDQFGQPVTIQPR